MASHVPNRLQKRSARNKREHWKFWTANRAPPMLATMARADRSARAEIMTSLASSMRSLFLARKARPHRAPAPADVRDYEENRRQRTHRLRIFAFSRLESVGDRRRGTTRADIVGSQRGRRAAVPFSRSRLRPTRSITSALIASCCTRLASRGSSG